MPHEFEVTVDSSMMKAAWHAWFFRGQRIWTLLIAAGLVLVSAYFDSRSGGLGTISIIGLTVLGLAVLIFVSSYMVGLRRSLSKLDMITDGRAAYRLTDETIEARSSLGSFSLAWTAIAELRRYRALVLLGFRGAMYSIVPASQIPEASLALANKTDAGNGSYGICRVIDASRSPSPDPSRSSSRLPLDSVWESDITMPDSRTEEAFLYVAEGRTNAMVKTFRP
jgi:hypothetical protein